MKLLKSTAVATDPAPNDAKCRVAFNPTSESKGPMKAAGSFQSPACGAWRGPNNPCYPNLICGWSGSKFLFVVIHFLVLVFIMLMTWFYSTVLQTSGANKSLHDRWPVFSSESFEENAFRAAIAHIAPGHRQHQTCPHSSLKDVFTRKAVKEQTDHTQQLRLDVQGHFGRNHVCA